MDDYVTIQKLSEKFPAYVAQLEPYVTIGNEMDRRYNFHTQYGDLIIFPWFYTSGEYKFIVNMGLAMVGHEIADPIVEKNNKENAYMHRWKEICLTGKLSGQFLSNASTSHRTLLFR